MRWGVGCPPCQAAGCTLPPPCPMVMQQVCGPNGSNGTRHGREGGDSGAWRASVRQEAPNTTCPIQIMAPSGLTKPCRSTWDLQRAAPCHWGLTATPVPANAGWQAGGDRFTTTIAATAATAAPTATGPATTGANTGFPRRHSRSNSKKARLLARRWRRHPLHPSVALEATPKRVTRGHVHFSLFHPGREWYLPTRVWYGRYLEGKVAGQDGQPIMGCVATTVTRDDGMGACEHVDNHKVHLTLRVRSATAPLAWS